MLKYLLLLLFAAAALRADGTLTLTARVDGPVFLTRTFDGPTFHPARVQATLTNSGPAPVKVDWRAPAGRLRPVVTGPRPESVETSIVPAAGKFTPPTPKDFPVLQPGESLVCPPIELPGTAGAVLTRLKGSGDYRVRLRYDHVPYPAEKEPLEDGCWRGVVFSNEIIVRVVEAVKPALGVQLGLASRPGPALTLYARNVTDAPLIVRPWDLESGALELFDPAGTPIAWTGGMDPRRDVPDTERLVTIQPGATTAFPLETGFTSEPVDADSPRGRLQATALTGYFRSWAVAGDQVIARAQLRVAVDRRLPVKSWRGSVTSATVTVPLDMTAHRRALLLDRINTFTLALDYAGEQGKPYYAVTFHVPEMKVEAAPFSEYVHITRDEAEGLIGLLAAQGLLREASTGPGAAAGYRMTITAAGCRWSVPLGFSLVMLTRLERLAASVAPTGHEAMTLLFGRLDGARGPWEAEAALRAPVTVDLPAGTLGEAIERARAWTAVPVPVTVDDFTRTMPLPALHFVDVPLAEVYAAFAQAADINCTVRNGTVKLMVWVL